MPGSVMNWLIDRLLVLAIPVLLCGAMYVLASLGFQNIGRSCAVAAIIASLVTVIVMHFA